MSFATRLKKMGDEQRKKTLRTFALTTPTNPDMLHDWVFYIGGVYIPRTKVCRDHVSPFDAFCMVYFEESPGTLIKGSRGLAGKTFWDAVMSWVLMCTKGAQVKVLGGSEEQSKNVQQYLTNTHQRTRGTLWEAPYAPRQLIAKLTNTMIQLNNGGNCEALRASQQSVRGPHPQILILDEIDEMEQKIFDAATGQPMEYGGIRSQLVCTSTHQNVGGTFEYARKHGREKGWNVIEWCLKETSAADGFVNPRMIVDKQAIMPAERWRIEVELQEPSHENRIFEEDAIDFLFDKRYGYHAVGQETFKGQPGDEYVFQPPLYHGGLPPAPARIVEPAGAALEIPARFPLGHFSKRDHTHGVDWGSRQDKTVVHSMKSESGRDVMAAWGSWRRQAYWKMADHANERVKRFGGPVVIDGTGLGTVMEELMDVPYETHEFSGQKATREMYNNFISAVQRGEKLYAYIESLRDTFRYLTAEHVYYDKHTPDEFVAAALEHAALESAQVPVMGRA